MKNDLISIIVPIYNGEKYINQCIDSILSQTYSNIELILVDDESPDNCPKICDFYAKKDKRVKVIHQKNTGVSGARNKGLNISEGGYICFVDQDDFIKPEYIDYLYHLIVSNDVDISVVPKVILYSNGQERYNESKQEDDFDILTGIDAACEMLYGKMEIGPWNKMISKKFLDEHGIKFYEDIFGGDGYAYSVESFANTNKVVFGYKGIYYYRVDNYNSETSKFRPRTFECSKKAVRIMMEEFKENRRLRKATKYALWNVYIYYLNTLVASNTKEKYKDEYKELRKYARMYAYRVIFAEVSFKRKIIGLSYFISPSLAATILSRHNKRRKFNK